MKNLCILALCACLYSTTVVAQTNTVPLNEPDYNKPRLFQSYPEKISVNTDAFSNLFTAAVGSTVDANLSGSSFRFSGEVVSAASKYDNRIISVVIRSSNFPGACLTLSKLTSDNGTVTYTGRIISKAHGDVYVLQQENGLFSLIKKNYYDLVNE
jgi:hypothetical protein